MPKHRQETPTFEKVARGIVIGGFVTSVTLFATHEVRARSQPTETACTVVPNYPEKFPDKDINESTIQNVLNIPEDQLYLVKGYAATCSTPLGPERFSRGVTSDPTTYNDFFGTSYDRCAVYGVAKQLIPPSGDKTTPALLVCVDLPNVPGKHQHQEQI